MTSLPSSEGYSYPCYLCTLFYHSFSSHLTFFYNEWIQLVDRFFCNFLCVTLIVKNNFPVNTFPYDSVDHNISTLKTLLSLHHYIFLIINQYYQNEYQKYYFACGMIHIFDKIRTK